MKTLFFLCYFLEMTACKMKCKYFIGLSLEKKNCNIIYDEMNKT